MNNASTEQIPRYFNEREIAKMLNVSVQSLRNDRSTGRGLPYVKFGRSVRYCLQDVLTHLEARKVVPGVS